MATKSTSGSSSFGKDLLAEFTGKACRDGVYSFNLENLLGTFVHLGVGVVAGELISRKVGFTKKISLGGVKNAVFA